MPETCSLGEHIVQVRAKSGITEYRSFWVGRCRLSMRSSPTACWKRLRLSSRNTTVHGVAESEDLDIYAVDAKQGDRISVEIEGLRLGSYRS